MFVFIVSQSYCHNFLLNYHILPVSVPQIISLTGRKLTFHGDYDAQIFYLTIKNWEEKVKENIYLVSTMDCLLLFNFHC